MAGVFGVFILLVLLEDFSIGLISPWQSDIAFKTLHVQDELDLNIIITLCYYTFTALYISLNHHHDERTPLSISNKHGETLSNIIHLLRNFLLDFRIVHILIGFNFHSQHLSFLQCGRSCDKTNTETTGSLYIRGVTVHVFIPSRQRQHSKYSHH